MHAQANAALLRGFLAAARPLLAGGGEVHATLVNRYPYTAWLHGLDAERSDKGALRGGASRAGAADAAGVEGLRYLGSAPFDFERYPGYRHQAATAHRGIVTCASCEL